MITWMQRHKKWLIITIWISTIAFVGAGFVGWGQYSYGDKAGAVAKVGDIEISQGELQKTYSRLYAQYNRQFQGKFDKALAKQIGLDKQALRQLEQQALLLNLAASYDLKVSDKELADTLKTQKYFFKDGVFSKELYKSVLSQNRLSIKEYEAGLKKELLIQKVFALLPVEVSDSEVNVLKTLTNIADKINYKVLTQNDISIDTSDALMKPFWQKNTMQYMNEVSYDLKYIKQTPINETYSDEKLADYYAQNKTHFKTAEGKITPLAEAKDAITKELNAKATKNQALRTHISYKKGKLDPKTQFQTQTISASNNPFSAETLKKVQELTPAAPYMKPILVNGEYLIFELVKINPASPQTYEQAKEAVKTAYIEEQKKVKLRDLANTTYKTFAGTTTDFITANDAPALTHLALPQAKEFLEKLFVSLKKQSYIQLNDGKIVLYNILEQKLLGNSTIDLSSQMKQLKSGIFNEALVKTLQEKYKTEIFMQGL